MSDIAGASEAELEEVEQETPTATESGGSLSESQLPAAPLTRPCSNCDAAMVADASECPKCHTTSRPWRFHEGAWWAQNEDDEWYWLDEKTNEWKLYSQSSGAEGDPSAFAEDEQESVLERFDTPNPWLQKLFSMPNYGQVPTMAVGLLREVSPDPDERLLAAVKCEHGRMRRGYLLATTKWLRWIRTFPSRAEDAWEYNWKLDYQGLSLTKAVLILGTGDQFQTYRARAKPFAAMYTVIQQAMAWEAAHADEMVLDAVTTPAPSLADELRELAALHQQGILTAEEFAGAKQKLMS